MGEMGKGGQSVQTPSYKMSKFGGGCTAHHGYYREQHSIVYWKVAMSVDFKSS